MSMISLTVPGVLCGACGDLIPEGVTACATCGAPRPREPFFYSVSLVKLGFLGATSFGFYLVWWFWSQLRAEAPGDGRWSAALKTVFSGFFFYSIARQVKEEAEKHDISCRYSPAVLTGVLWITSIAVRVLEAPGSVLLAVLCIPAPLLLVQSTINRVNAMTSGDQPRGWRWWEIAIAIALALFWALIVIGLLVPDLADESITTEVGANARLVIGVSLPRPALCDS